MRQQLESEWRGDPQLHGLPKGLASGGSGAADASPADVQLRVW